MAVFFITFYYNLNIAEGTFFKGVLYGCFPSLLLQSKIKMQQTNFFG